MKESVRFVALCACLFFFTMMSANAATTFTLSPYSGYPQGTDNFAYYQSALPNTVEVINHNNMEINPSNGKLYYRYIYNDGSQRKSDIYEFDPAISKWNYFASTPVTYVNTPTTSPEPISLSAAPFLFVNNKLYISGGGVCSDCSLKSYDSSGQNEQAISGWNAGSTRMISYNNNIYLAGLPLGKSTYGFYEYNPSTGVFTQYSDSNTLIVDDFEVFGGKLYIAGLSLSGNSKTGALYEFDGTTLTKVVSYNPGGQTSITDLYSMNNQLYVVTNTVNNYYPSYGLYYIGGNLLSQILSNGKLWTYDSVNKQLVTTSYPEDASGLVSVLGYNGKIYASTTQIMSTSGNSIVLTGPKIKVLNGATWSTLLDRSSSNDQALKLERVHNGLMYLTNSFGTVFVYNACHPQSCVPSLSPQPLPTQPVIQPQRCASADDIILRIEAPANALGEIWNGAKTYPIEICFSTLFPGYTRPANPHQCKSNLNNRILILNSPTGALARAGRVA